MPQSHMWEVAGKVRNVELLLAPPLFTRGCISIFTLFAPQKITLSCLCLVLKPGTFCVQGKCVKHYTIEPLY